MEPDNSNYTSRDLNDLVRGLRRRDAPEVRAKAAHAMGDLNDYEAVEPLTLAILLDPDLQVQKAAREALHIILGNEDRYVLQMASADEFPDGEGWLLDLVQVKDSFWIQPASRANEEEGELQDESGESLSLADRQTLNGLVTLANHPSTNRKTRLKAIRAMGEVDDIQAYQALAGLALWSDDAEVMAAAHQALEAKFGENLDPYLDSLRVEEEVEEDDEEEVAQADEPVQTAFARQNYQGTPVMQEERVPYLLWIVAGLVLIGLVVVFILTR